MADRISALALDKSIHIFIVYLYLCYFSESKGM